MRFLLLFSPILSTALLACQGTSPGQSGGDIAASDHYVVLTQKALTYQADCQYDDWAELLADDVEYHLGADGSDVPPLAGKADVLAYWRQWQKTSGIREMRLSDFSLMPVEVRRPLPIADLAGVYVAAAFRQRTTHASGQIVERPVSLWLHFDEGQRIDRIYCFQPDEPPP